MIRPDLHWALDAVLPHVGKTKGVTVGLQSYAGSLHVYACDSYSAGMARIDGPHDWNLHLSRSEATDLMRFVRPTLKAHQEEVLSHQVTDTELHVGIEGDSAVFELAEPQKLTLDYLLLQASGFNAARGLALPSECELVQQPALVAKYAKAQRLETDRLRWYPIGDVALVTVGTDFLGLVAGMSRDDEGSMTLASFLQNAEQIGKVA